ncbi:MAG TPA: phytanoyl-CoA dioxygenase family protein [Candidatus Dormibacteraeota bacterium]|nr:phytanoyl-CoA dioxygenase family protein [Candidatus Dormibacteraeota bacterium]
MTTHTGTGSTGTIRYRINDSKKGFPVRPVHVEASRQDLDRIVESGFLLTSDWFPRDLLDRMAAAIDRLTTDEQDHPSGEHIPGNGFYLRHLMDKDPAFLELLHFQPTLSIARALLGPQVWMDVEARVAYAGEPDRLVPWHIHHRVIPDPLPPFFCYPHAINCLLYLDDIDDAEGPLVILPGSHRQHALQIPDGDERDLAGQVLVRPRQGDCLIMHVNLWHRTLRTRAECRQRRVVIWGYQPSWLKSAVTRGVKVEHRLTGPLLEGGDPETVELLDGFHW